MPRRDKRRRAERRGRWAEAMALWSLRLRGYRILARDFRTPVGEIDIVARRGGILVAIEVKARSDLLAASDALLPRQRRRIERALVYFLAHRPELSELAQRFDLMLVTPRRPPRHLADAWRPDRD